MQTNSFTPARIWEILGNVVDPEVPVLSVVDLGIIRHVDVSEQQGGAHVQVTITPTYSGCPAMDMIAAGIRMELLLNGVHTVDIVNRLSPAWTTDWMTEHGRQKLREYGIAPPVAKLTACAGKEPEEDKGIQCPHCGSRNTQVISHFGSTACKALHRCNDCKEPFDYFKCH